MILLGIVVLADCTLGSYHLTHGGGWVSGTIELSFAVLLVTCAFIFGRSRPKNNPRPGHDRYRTALFVIIGVLVTVFLILSGYHFTHHGLRSGIIELLLAIILSAIGFLMA
jgi:hypothetical protein